MAIKKRLPSGKVVLRTKKDAYSFRLCAYCKKILHGVPKSTAALRKLPKSKKTPTRAYAGFLCANCTKEVFREKARLV